MPHGCRFDHSRPPVLSPYGANIPERSHTHEQTQEPAYVPAATRTQKREAAAYAARPHHPTAILRPNRVPHADHAVSQPDPAIKAGRNSGRCRGQTGVALSRSVHSLRGPAAIPFGNAARQAEPVLASMRIVCLYVIAHSFYNPRLSLELRATSSRMSASAGSRPALPNGIPSGVDHFPHATSQDQPPQG